MAMKDFERLSNCFYGVNLYEGSITMKKGYNVMGFFIVEHPTESGWLAKQTVQFLTAGFYGGNFYGKQAETWQNGFIAQWSKMRAGSMLPEQLPIAVYSDLNSFADELRAAKQKDQSCPVIHTCSMMTTSFTGGRWGCFQGNAFRAVLNNSFFIPLNR